MSTLDNAHKQFAADSFNAVWSLIEKPSRDLAETREMIRLAEVSFYHWLQIPGHTEANISIGLWQLSRVYSLAYEPITATHYANECLKVSQEANLPAFYLAYAHEALARAAALDGDTAKSSSHLSNAATLLTDIPEEDTRRALQADLDSIPQP